MRLLWVAIAILALSCSEAKKRKKFEGDFEFADETLDDSKREGDKKTWIYDPDSELCQALKCRKEERCLLENAYTAVCVSRSEIKRNGDVVVNTRITTTTSRSLDDEDDYDDIDDDDIFDKDMGDTLEDDLGLEFYDLDGTSKPSAILKKCSPCPVIKPSYICGTDNVTYSSLCKLDYANCMHDTIVKAGCKGFCPCPSASQLKKDQQTMRLSQFENKYKSTVQNVKDTPKVIFAPEVAKLKNELFKKNFDSSTDKHRQRGYNDILPEKKESLISTECSDSSFNSMGNRLLDWFSVLMAQPNQKKHIKPRVRFSSACAKEVVWMFGYLDSNQDHQLSMSELYDLEHNERENCLKPFLDKCDENRDIFLSSGEWCRCFSKADRPCVAMRRRSKPGLLGAYNPTCDPEGFFLPRQCHSAIGTCWCVDKHGVEQNGSRTRGELDCESILQRNGLMDDDSADEIEEGSGDY